MALHSQRGQVLMDLLAAIAFFLLFFLFSIELLKHQQQTSYRYLLTHPTPEMP